MNMAKEVEKYRKDHGIAEVPIRDMDREAFLLYGWDGRAFREVGTNIFAEVDERHSDAVYLSTGKHGGGITLRPLYIRVNGDWLNASTGHKAPPGMLDGTVGLV